MPTDLLRASSGDDKLIICLALAGLTFAAACKFTEYLVFGAILFDVGPWAFLGIPCAIWIFQRDRRAIIAALLVGFLTAGALQIALRLPDLPIITGIGAGGFFVLVFKLAIDGHERRQTGFVLCAGLLAPIAQLICPLFQRLTTAYPETLDGRALLVDRAMGIPDGFYEGARALLLSMPIRVVIFSSYSSITLALGLLILCKVKRGDRGWIVATVAFILAGVFGSALYHLFPATGPLYAFLMQPDLQPDVAPIPVPVEFIRNGMPSLHTTWALLIFLNSRDMGHVARGCCSVFLVLTLCSTLILGEHYVIDLIVAAPFALAIQAAAQMLVAPLDGPDRAERASRRAAALAFGATVTGAWLLLLVRHVEALLGAPHVTESLAVVSILGFAVGSGLLVPTWRYRTPGSDVALATN